MADRLVHMESAATLVLVLMAVLASVPATALTVTAPIPELLGEFEPASSIAIDLGREFHQIDEVSISITASGTPDVFRSCPPEGCFESERPPGVVVRFHPETSPPHGAPELSVLFSAQPTTSVALSSNLGGAYDFLLDGTARLETRWLGNTIFGSPTQLASATLLVTQASLTVSGVPVPEPGTALLIGGGLAALSASRRTASSSSAPFSETVPGARVR